MKKLLIVSLSLVLVLAMALTANAGIRNTVHDYQSNGASSGFDATAQRGMCSYCHIPHSSAGDRLWPTAGSSQQRIVGVVGILCASCHVSTYMNNNSPATDTRALDRTTDIYNTGRINHVLIDDGTYGNNTEQQLFGSGTTQFAQATVWPYCGTTGTAGVGGPKVIECSSCHNPHNETITGGQSAISVDESASRLGYGNDFLRSAMYNTTSGVAFCEYCHEEKTRAKTAGPQNSIGTGTHPVGATANAGSPAQADIHIESLERITLRGSTPPIVSAVQYDQGIGWETISGVAVDYGAGTHLTSYSTGGVTCQSCHLVHGAPRGTGNTWLTSANGGSYMGTGTRAYLAASDDGFASILAIDNDPNGGGFGYTYRTEGRSSGDYNDLCIDCHETTPSVGTQWLNDNNPDRLTPDQGTGWMADGHPINISPDGRSESGFDLTVVNPSWSPAAKWAGLAGTAGSDAFSANGRWNGAGAPTNARSEIVCLTCHSIHDGVNGTPILRTGADNFCQECHTNSIGGISHPVNNGSAMRDNPDAATWPNGDNLPLANYYNGDTTTGTSNYRRSSGDVTTDMACHTCHAAHDGSDGFMLRITDDNSRICTGCHTDIVAQAANYGTVGSGIENPANYIAEYQELPNDSLRLGSHYTGTVTNSTDTIGELRWAYTGGWTDTTSATDQTSHWGGPFAGPTTPRRMQCQSCHTPHDAASGLVEYNTFDGDSGTQGGGPGDQLHPADNEDYNVNYDGTTTTKMCATPNSALLLGNNGRSKMCATCHWPKGTHVTTIYTVPAKPDTRRQGGTAQKKKYRDFCTRTNAFIIKILNGAQEERYLVYDLIANDPVADDDPNDASTPESPTNFPPYFAGVVPSDTVAEMLCDSCHAPHGAATGSGAFILEAGKGDATGVYAGGNQRVTNRNYQDLCWKCHDK